jgi:hypothetical protein
MVAARRAGRPGPTTRTPRETAGTGPGAATVPSDYARPRPKRSEIQRARSVVRRRDRAASLRRDCRRQARRARGRFARAAWRDRLRALRRAARRPLAAAFRAGRERRLTGSHPPFRCPSWLRTMRGRGRQDFWRRSRPGRGRPTGEPAPERVPRGFNRNDHRNRFDPGNDCQKAVNMTSCDDDADPGQRRGVRQPALPAPAVAKILPAGAGARLHAPATPVTVSAGAVRRSPAPSRLGKAAQLGWTRKAVDVEAPANILDTATVAGAIRSRAGLSRPPLSERDRHRGTRFAPGDGRRTSAAAPASPGTRPPPGRLAEILRRRICRSMLQTAARMVTLAQIWVAQFRQRRYR